MASARERIRLALLYAACVPAAWAAVEIHLRLSPRPHLDPEMPAAWRIRDDDVGVRPAPGVSWREALWLGDEAIYDVVYTIDAHGRRVAPEAAGGADALCVLFFGCSFAFGTGIGDEDTLPWLTSVATGRRHEVHNFSFSGWGPHQMLAALETGQVERSLPCDPTHALYVSIHDHVRRVAGRSPWDPHGPRFELREDGSVVRDGNFDDRPSLLRAWPWLARSEVVRILSEHFRETQRDFDRFSAVVAASRDRVASRWPGADFRVLLWDKRWKHDPEYWQGLERRGLRVHFVSEILPDQREHASRYAVSPQDGHPNRTANERIAAWVAREILGGAGDARSEPPRAVPSREASEGRARGPATTAAGPATASAPSRAGGP